MTRPGEWLVFGDIKQRIRKGMAARTTDGKPLGRVIEADHAIVTDGDGADFDFLVDWDQVTFIDDSEVVVEPKDAPSEVAQEVLIPKGVATARPITERPATPPRPGRIEALLNQPQTTGEIRLRKRVVREADERLDDSLEGQEGSAAHH